MDRPWWNVHIAEVRRRFHGELVCPLDDCYGIFKMPCDPAGNSGAGAISLAEYCGAKRVLLLGYDCQHTGGKRHWFGNHPNGLANAGRVETWPAQFAKVAKKLQHIDIINCSRATALTCFPRQELEVALCESSLLHLGHRQKGTSRLRA